MSNNLDSVAYNLAANGKGILAADESTATIKKRFDSIAVESTEDLRRDYRHMLFSSSAMKDYISGVILYDETLRQKTADGQKLSDIIKSAGAMAGIKVDTGAKSLAGYEGETITEGLDNLRDRLKEYSNLGASFAKWRSVVAIDECNLPHQGAVRQNMYGLARYAALCQEASIVPIVEPEILMDGHPGTHCINRSYEVTSFVLHELFTALKDARVRLEAIVLKPSMVIDGKNARKASVEEVAEKTITCLKNNVPSAVPSIAFLSGGQNVIEATEHLNAMNQLGNLPWNLTFSYGRALQADALRIWAGKSENFAKAQEAFAKRARMNSLAALGKWSKDLENN